MRRTLLSSLLLLGACGAAELEILGTWATPWGTEAITAEKWQAATIVSFDNDQNFAVTQNPPDDAYAPNKFARVVWTEPSADAFHYCTVAFGLDTAEKAETSTQTADASQPDQTGCGGFPWTKMTRKAGP